MKYLFSFLIIGLLLSVAISCSLPHTIFQKEVWAEQVTPKVVPGLAQALEAPKTLEEAKTLGERILLGFPNALRRPWQEALAIWGKMVNWFKNIWYSYIFPWLQSIWSKINSLLGREVERRKPEIKEEFEKEKQEMKEDIPKTAKSLWERFRELIK